jgi:hypothetical protein
MNGGIEYILVGNSALYKCDYMGRELSRMEYGKGWKKMDGSDYFMFTFGSNTSERGLSILRITKELALKITLSRGGSVYQF